MPRPKPNGLPPAQAKQLRTDALLDKAAEVFLELGYEAASTAEIAKRASVSKQTLYAGFRTKRKLFLAVIDYRTSKLPKRFLVLFEQTHPIRAVLLDTARALLSVILSPDNVALSRIVYMEAPRIPEAARYLVERGPDRVGILIADYLSKQDSLKLIRVEDPILASTHFTALVIGDLLHRALLGINQYKTKKALETRVENSVDAFLKLYPTS